MSRSVKIPVFVLIFSIFILSCNTETDRPYAEKGVLNLTGYQLEEKVIPLDGEWEFYWKKLISPQDFKEHQIKPEYVILPAIWNDLAKNDSVINTQGFATYRLQIYNQSEDSVFGIKISKAYVAYKLWVNDRLIAEAGKVSFDKDSVVPSREYDSRYFVVDTNKLDLVLQVSNFNQRKGGIQSSILFGSEKLMSRQERKVFGISLFLLGLLLIVAINHFILFYLRKDVKSSLYFSLFIFSIALNIIFSEHYNLSGLIFPDLSWNLILKFDYISDYLSIYLFLSYISSLYNDESNKRINNAVLLFTILMIAFILISPPIIFTYTNTFFYIVVGIILLYILLILAKAILSQKEAAKHALLGTFVLLLTLINDGLNNSLVIHTFDTLTVGLIIFIIIQSYLISLRLSKAYQYSLQLSDELNYFNENLEQIVKDRTLQIEQAKEELEVQSESLKVANEEIIKINQILEGQSVELKKKNKALTDSINYAKRLQQAILPDKKVFEQNFDEHFIFFQPKDIVSGDFYWYSDVDTSWDFDESNKIKIVIAADCTGHGVPGAFMTLLGHNFLHLIVNIQEVIDPEQILYKLDQLVVETLKQNEDGSMKDGMDIAVLTIDEEKETVAFSGAGNPLFYIRNNELHEIKGVNFGIGGVLRKAKTFEPHKIPYQKGDIFYIFSDGFSDQIGGPEGRKYYKKKFKEFLLEIHQKSMNEQRYLIEKEFEEWKGNKKQIDDILIMGFKF